MNAVKWTAIGACLLVVAGGAGYWWGAGRPLGRAVEPAAVPAMQAGVKSERRILYYRNPMGLPDTSPVPKKDPMGMDYTPVYEGEEPATDGNTVRISVEKVQKLGVRTEAAAVRELTRTVRAVSIVQADERRLHTVAPRFDGWIERLYVNTTGQAVRKGDALMDVYSPDLVAAQQEYLIARKGLQSVAQGGPEIADGMRRLIDGALQRMRNWDISETELKRLQAEGTARQYVTLRSTVSGVVLEKPSIQGKRFMAGEVLYQIADLSTVWVLADVFEQDLAVVRPGQPAKIGIDAYPGKEFNGKVTFIYPTVTPETRTAKVRVELANPQGLLKPAMYARVEIVSGRGRNVLSVPDSSVLDTGTRQVVLVDLGEGRFEPRPIKPGARADGYVEILEGVKAGEAVVVSANFLIDAESNLKAALGGFGHGSHGEKPAGAVPDKPGATAANTPPTHRGEGSIEALDAKAGTITLAHGPIASLKWPAMSMEFRSKDPALLRPLRKGQKVIFEFVDAGGGEYRIVSIQPAGGGHTGH